MQKRMRHHSAGRARQRARASVAGISREIPLWRDILESAPRHGRPSGSGEALTDGVQMQVAFAKGVDNLAPVLWDAPLFDGVGAIGYDGATGAFHLRREGLYYAAWWLLAQNAAPLGVRFFLEMTDASSFPQCAPASLGGADASGGTILYGDQMPRADIVIVRVG